MNNFISNIVTVLKVVRFVNEKDLFEFSIINFDWNEFFCLCASLPFTLCNI